MTSESGLKLTSKDRVLLHLKDYMQYRGDREYPAALTQKGISEMTGLRLSHVPRTLKGLVSEEFIDESKAHVKGEKRRYKVYMLTGKGVTEAGRIIRDLRSQTVLVDGEEVSVANVLDRENEAYRFRLLLRLAGEEISSIKRKATLVGPMPDVSDFVDRMEELAHLKEMLEARASKVMLIYGSQGYGSSALASKFVRTASDQWSVGWIGVERTLKKLKGSLAQVLASLGLESISSEQMARPKKLAAALSGKKVMLVFDGYFDVADDVVEFFGGLVSAIRDTEDFKILVTVREDTPPYNRFYTILDIHDGVAGEVHIRGLDLEHCRIMLGMPNIEPDAMKRLFLFTRGCPTTLKLLARGDENEMREKSRFSPDEIKLMLWLKGQTKE
jgi:DNA-binding PadR family transcriptional regulator